MQRYADGHGNDDDISEEEAIEACMALDKANVTTCAEELRELVRDARFNCHQLRHRRNR